MAPRKESAPVWRCSSSVAALARAKLESSGILAHDAAAIGFEPVDDARTLDPAFEGRPALKIPYYRPGTVAEPLRPHPRWPGFYRVRYLGDPPPSFADQTAAKESRYAQPPGSGVCAYFPRGVCDWADTLKDVKRPLIITEGELKAAKACCESFPTIGLGGVFNWKSGRDGVGFLPELEAIPWERRKVFLAFDSDFRTNPMVLAAMGALADMLYDRGALPFVAPLPELGEGKKTGLDDFLIARGPERFRDALNEAQPLTLARALWTLNDEVTYVADPGVVLVNATGQKVAPEKFSAHAYANRGYYEQVLDEKGETKLVKANAAKSWLSWPLRSEVGRMAYEPGEQKGIHQNCAGYVYNVWKGWGAEPKEGDAKPFFDLLQHLFVGTGGKELEWFLNWCAYPLQHPGYKLFTAALFHGSQTGTGKSLVGMTLGKIYGPNFAYLRQTDLLDERREWAENKQFALGDEVTGTDGRRKHSDFIKTMITQDRIRLNPKYVPSYDVEDRINYFFTSNHPDAFFLEEADRRFFVHEVTVGPLAAEFYDRYAAWLENGGAGHLFYALLKRDLKSFNPAAAALRTAARERMIGNGKTEFGAWAFKLSRDPGPLLHTGQAPVPGDLFTAKELLALFDPGRESGVSSVAVGKELGRLGVPLAAGGCDFLDGRNVPEQFFVLRNRENWAKRSVREIEGALAKKYERKDIPTLPAGQAARRRSWDLSLKEVQGVRVAAATKGPRRS